MAELSVFRHENKYLLTYDEAVKLADRLKTVLKKDSYSENGPYTVRSLYLDSVDNTDFFEKLAGDEVRKKIRLRVYSPDDKCCKLEIKQKNGDLQHKVSLVITREEAFRTAQGDFTVLTKYFDEYPDAAYIYTELQLGVYRPRAIVEYDRLAFVHELFSTRITFDMNVRSGESDLDLFAENPSLIPVFNNMVVLEVKYNGTLLDSISDVLRPFNLTRTSLSKYCISRGIYFDY